MLKLTTLTCDALRALSMLLFLSLFDEAASVMAQNLRVVYDGRIERSITKPSHAEVQLIRRYALPKARRFWRSDDACREGFEVVDAASGSFTKPNAAQRAILYRFCIRGHNIANNGIVIIEGGSIVAHIVYDGGEDYSIGALEDINGNGLSEIIIGDGSTNQGYTVNVALLIEISPPGVRKFGIADVYEDNCGAVEQCETNAYKISVKPGPTPIFYREAFRQRNERWTRAGNAARYRLRPNESSYNLLD
ncbi:MAG TPA: hypothetical protein VF553_00575 [Pyrinomonadaceae bacterium]|jgi:hypothetical protein